MAGDDGAWRTRETRTLFETPWFRLQQDEITLPGGEDITYTWIDRGGFVVVVPLLDDGRVVMERVYRHTLGRAVLECPAGNLDGEDGLVAGPRELEEETGYRARRWTHLGNFTSTPGLSNERFDVLLAQDLRADGQIDREVTEEIEVVLPRFDEVERMSLAGELGSGPSALAILLAARSLRG